MSNPAPVQDLPTKAPLNANQAIIRGRIIEVKRTENGCYTAIALPAPDQYSHPQAVEVRSARLLGKPQDDITIRVGVGGFRRGYKDKMGEQAYATNVILQALED